MNKILSSGLVLGAMISLVGCGGGSSDTPNSAGTNPTSVATGTAYYIDSAVSGVNYTCGSTEGITGADGEFTFEVGASCTFYLGDIELRSVGTELLADGGEVQETDIEIARILQSLDSDGNPDNGITINAEIIAAIEAAGITELPDTVAEMDEMLAVVETAGGTVVSAADAEEHLLTNLIVGKTLYQHWNDGENDKITALTFGADGNLVMVDGEETETVVYRIEGNVIYTAEEDGEEAHPVAEMTDGYIKINETSGEVTTFYFTREAAQAAPAMIDNGGDGSNEPFAFSTDYLNSKSLYFVQYDDFGYEDVGMKWNMARMDFTVSTFSWTEYGTADTGTHTFTYTVNSDGNIVYNYGDGDDHVISFNDMTNDYIKVCQDGDCNTYLFFDEGKARDFRDSQN